MRTVTLTPYVIFGCLYTALLLAHARSSWRKYRAFPGVKAFQFYLLDTVAAAVGLSPTAWLVAQAARGASPYPVDAWLLAGAAGVSQVAGLFIGRIHGTVPPQEPPSEWIDALWVLGGALYGLVLLAVSFVIFVIGYNIVAFLFLAGPGYIVELVGFVALVAYAVYLHS